MSCTPSYLIYIENNQYKAKNGLTGNVDYSGSDASSVINSAINALTNGGKVFIKAGKYTISTSINIATSFIDLEGEGKSTKLVPTDNIHVIKIIAPLTRVRISNLYIEDTDFKQTSTAGIYLDQYNGQVNECVLENISMYYTWGGIYTRDLASNINYSIMACSLRKIRINQYRGIGLNLYSVFDTLLDDILVTQYSASSNHAFYFRNMLDGGDFFMNLKALGKQDTMGEGIHIEDLSHCWFTHCYADKFKEGIVLLGTVDRVNFTQCGVRACSDQGWYVSHSNGWVNILNIEARDCTYYGLRNFGKGGNVNIIGGDVRDNGGSINPASGDYILRVKGYDI